MKISHVQIRNFRNFKAVDVSLHDHAVIVGENKVGKTNFIYALRLILDPSLPDRARQLRDEDFWDGLPRPLTKDDFIQIAVDIQGIDEDDNHFAQLAEHLVDPKTMTARLTYVFRALPTLTGDPETEGDYEFLVYGGDNPEQSVGHELRRRLPLDLFPAMRDAEGDLASWRRSPLRPLLNAAAAEADREQLEGAADAVLKATATVLETPEIARVAKAINTKLLSMVGGSHAIEFSLGFSPTDPDRLVRALRVLFDDGKRGVPDASVGTANLLYLTLKALELDLLVAEGTRDHTFLAIEEPEAHLHPHLQRLVYRQFLHSRGSTATVAGKANKAAARTEPGMTVVLTTHSPYVVSISPLRSIVLLRHDRDTKATSVTSTATSEFTAEEVEDLERYLDITRGEIVFAKGVLLVEGDAELYLVPALARAAGYDLDQRGITVCSVSGTNFRPYIRLLGPGGLNIPFAVITDMDPRKGKDPLGEARVRRLLKVLLGPTKYERANSADLLTKIAPSNGIFLNSYTFEVDLFRAGADAAICDTVIELTVNNAARNRARDWKKKPASMMPGRLLADIDKISKGRFAQRLASRVSKEMCPSYILQAIQHVANQCA